MSAARPLAGLSIDLDDRWTYLQTRGEPRWETATGFLDRALPRARELLAARGLAATVFATGRDAAMPAVAGALRGLAADGHEIANHSFAHRPWQHHLGAESTAADIVAAEQAIEAATGRRPVGYRGPGHSLGAATLDILCRRGYRYDSSTWPTPIMPLVRYLYLRGLPLSAEQRRERRDFGGRLADGLRPLRPYRWRLGAGRLLELPVTTLPLLRLPLHFTYLQLVAARSPALAAAYFDLGLRLCRLRRVTPILLLHATDFLGAEDEAGLGGIPGMGRRLADKLAFLGAALDRLQRGHRALPLADLAAALEGRDDLALVTPA